VRIKHLLEKSKRDKRILMYRANATWLGYLSKVARRKVAKRFVFLIQLNKIFAVPINDCRALFDYSTKVLKHFIRIFLYLPFSAILIFIFLYNFFKGRKIKI
jgi:hypothetical protein